MLTQKLMNQAGMPGLPHISTPVAGGQRAG